MDNLMTTYNSYYSVKYDKKGNQIQCSRAQGGWLKELGRSIISVGVAGLAAQVPPFPPGISYCCLQNSDTESSMVCWSLEHTVF